MSQKMISNAISAVLALGLSSTSAATSTNNSASSDMDMMGTKLSGMEKCYGVAKAGMNDCGTHTHQCAGEAKLDNSKEEWLLVPTGLCNKIVGGKLEDSKKS